MRYTSNASEKLYDRGLAEGKAEREALLAENAKLRKLLRLAEIDLCSFQRQPLNLELLAEIRAALAGGVK